MKKLVLYASISLLCLWAGRDRNLTFVAFPMLYVVYGKSQTHAYDLWFYVKSIYRQNLFNCHISKCIRVALALHGLFYVLVWSWIYLKSSIWSLIFMHDFFSRSLVQMHLVFLFPCEQILQQIGIFRAILRPVSHGEKCGKFQFAVEISHFVLILIFYYGAKIMMI